MASTKIPEVKAAILEILQGAKALSGVTVTAEYRIAERQPEHVWLWKSKTRDRQFRGLGHETAKPPRVDEEILVTLRVVTIGAETAAKAEARLWELVEATEAALREQLKLNGVARLSLVEQIEDEPLVFDKKLGHHALLTVMAETRT